MTVARALLTILAVLFPLEISFYVIFRYRKVYSVRLTECLEAGVHKCLKFTLMSVHVSLRCCLSE